MKALIRPPFFEVGVKNYLYGDTVLRLAEAADAAAERYDIDVLFVAPYTEIHRVAERAKRLIVLAPYMDALRPGRGMADVLPEAVVAAGAKGVVVNHCEKPMTLPQIRRTIERANELDMISFACADTVAEAVAVAQLHPDILNPEPTELIGTGRGSDMVKAVFPDILVEQAAGVASGRQVYELILAGADGAGAASGICLAPDPQAMAEEMIASVRLARDELRRRAAEECV
jgi:triosephosphate isomerase